jgi:hypothetical protein
MVTAGSSAYTDGATTDTSAAFVPHTPPGGSATAPATLLMLNPATKRDRVLSMQFNFKRLLNMLPSAGDTHIRFCEKGVIVTITAPSTQLLCMLGRSDEVNE